MIINERVYKLSEELKRFFNLGNEFGVSCLQNDFEQENYTNIWFSDSDHGCIYFTVVTPSKTNKVIIKIMVWGDTPYLELNNCGHDIQLYIVRDKKELFQILNNYVNEYCFNNSSEDTIYNLLYKCSSDINSKISRIYD